MMTALAPVPGALDALEAFLAHFEEPGPRHDDEGHAE